MWLYNLIIAPDYSLENEKKQEGTMFFQLKAKSDMII